jgi:hypothetical protein
VYTNYPSNCPDYNLEVTNTLTFAVPEVVAHQSLFRWDWNKLLFSQLKHTHSCGKVFSNDGEYADRKMEI